MDDGDNARVAAARGARVAAAVVVLGDDVAIAVEQPDPAVMNIGVGNAIDVDGDDRSSRQIDLVEPAQSVSGGVDGRMKCRRRVEDVRIACERKVVGDVERGCDRVVRGVRSQRGVAGAEARPWRRFAMIGEISEQDVIAPVAPDRVVSALPGQHVCGVVPGKLIVEARASEVLDRDICIAAGIAAGQREADPGRSIGIVRSVAAGAAVQCVRTIAARQRVVTGAARELIGLCALPMIRSSNDEPTAFSKPAMMSCRIAAPWPTIWTGPSPSPPRAVPPARSIVTPPELPA